MISSKKESIEDMVVRILSDKSLSVKGLKILLAKDEENITIQGIYKILRLLIQKEVVIKQGNIYSLSEEWRNGVIDLLNKKSRSLKLSEGEKIVFDFNSLAHLDQQWKNIILPLHDRYPDMPIFFYNPHETWIHLGDSRKKSEYEYYDSFLKNKNYGFALFGGKTIHDIKIKKELQSDYLQIALGIEYFSKNEYPTIFADYIVTTKLSSKLAEEIEHIYQTSIDTAELESRLQKMGIEKKKVKLIIERDKEKAKKLRKKLSKEFFVPRELVEKYELY